MLLNIHVFVNFLSSTFICTNCVVYCGTGTQSYILEKYSFLHTVHLSGAALTGADLKAESLFIRISSTGSLSNNNLFNKAAITALNSLPFSLHNSLQPLTIQPQACDPLVSPLVENNTIYSAYLPLVITD